ncbi:MAG: hypothetical protein WC501_02905 [Candidatus Micrarchaeia archaeon]
MKFKLLFLVFFIIPFIYSQNNCCDLIDQFLPSNIFFSYNEETYDMEITLISINDSKANPREQAEYKPIAIYMSYTDGSTKHEAIIGKYTNEDGKLVLNLKEEFQLAFGVSIDGTSGDSDTKKPRTFRFIHCPFECECVECFQAFGIDVITLGYTPQSLFPNIDQYLQKPKYLFPTSSTFIYTPKEDVTPAFCLPVVLIFAILASASYLSGRNPFSSFDLSTPRFRKQVRYSAGRRGVYIDPASVVGAAVRIASYGVTKGHEGELSKMSGEDFKKLAKGDIRGAAVLPMVGQGISSIGSGVQAAKELPKLFERSSTLMGDKSEKGKAILYGDMFGKIGTSIADRALMSVGVYGLTYKDEKGREKRLSTAGYFAESIDEATRKRFIEMRKGFFKKNNSIYIEKEKLYINEDNFLYNEKGKKAGKYDSLTGKIETIDGKKRDGLEVEKALTVTLGVLNEAYTQQVLLDNSEKRKKYNLGAKNALVDAELKEWTDKQKEKGKEPSEREINKEKAKIENEVEDYFKAGREFRHEGTTYRARFQSSVKNGAYFDYLIVERKEFGTEPTLGGTKIGIGAGVTQVTGGGESQIIGTWTEMNISGLTQNQFGSLSNKINSFAEKHGMEVIKPSDISENILLISYPSAGTTLTSISDSQSMYKNFYGKRFEERKNAILEIMQGDHYAQQLHELSSVIHQKETLGLLDKEKIILNTKYYKEASEALSDAIEKEPKTDNKVENKFYRAMLDASLSYYNLEKRGNLESEKLNLDALKSMYHASIATNFDNQNYKNSQAREFFAYRFLEDKSPLSPDNAEFFAKMHTREVTQNELGRKYEIPKEAKDLDLHKIVSNSAQLVYLYTTCYEQDNKQLENTYNLSPSDAKLIYTNVSLQEPNLSTRTTEYKDPANLDRNLTLKEVYTAYQKNPEDETAKKMFASTVAYHIPDRIADLFNPEIATAKEFENISSMPQEKAKREAEKIRRKKKKGE